MLNTILCTRVSNINTLYALNVAQMHRLEPNQQKNTKKCSHHSVHREIKPLDEENAESVPQKKDENLYRQKTVEEAPNANVDANKDGDDILDVQELSLCRQNISEIPNTIVQYENLKLLKGCCNTLRQIPNFICDLAQLKHLILSNNMLVYLPRDIGKLKNLESLDVSDNRLKELPDTFSALQSLTVLNLTNNRFDEVPRIIGCIRTLHILSIEGNAINDVPVEVIRLPYLSVLKTRPLAPKSFIEVRSSGSSIDIAERTARRVIIKHLHKKCKLNVHVKRLLMQVKECSFCNGPYFRVNYTVITNQFYNSRYIPVRHEMCSLHFTSEPTMFYLLYIRPNYQGIVPRDSEERLPFSMIFNYHAYGDKLKKYIDEQNEEEGTILSLIYHYKRRCDRD